MLGERLPPFVSLVRAAQTRTDPRSVRDQLVDIVTGGLAFYEESMPMAGSVFAEPELLARHSAAMREKRAGPDKPITILADFIRRKQEDGTVRFEADPAAAAALLLGACFQNAFLDRFAGRAPISAERRQHLAESFVDGLWAGLEPTRTDPVR